MVTVKTVTPPRTVHPFLRLPWYGRPSCEILRVGFSQLHIWYWYIGSSGGASTSEIPKNEPDAQVVDREKCSRRRRAKRTKNPGVSTGSTVTAHKLECTNAQMRRPHSYGRGHSEKTGFLTKFNHEHDHAPGALLFTFVIEVTRLSQIVVTN